MHQEENKRREWLAELVKQFKSSLPAGDAETFNPELELLHGDPVTTIPELVHHLNADVLAMGTLSRSGLGGMLIGNTAEAILNRVNCSVVTFKPQGFESPIPRHSRR